MAISNFFILNAFIYIREISNILKFRLLKRFSYGKTGFKAKSQTTLVRQEMNKGGEPIVKERTITRQFIDKNKDGNLTNVSTTRTDSKFVVTDPVFGFGGIINMPKSEYYLDGNRQIKNIFNLIDNH